jgi:hypothetical protein
VSETKFAPNLVHEEFDVITDPACAIAAKVAQVLADFGCVDSGKFGEFFRGNVGYADLELLTEDAQIHRKPGNSCLGNSAS